MSYLNDTDRINELYWEVVWPEIVAEENAIDDVSHSTTPSMMVEWHEGERFGATHLQDWCETRAGILNRAIERPSGRLDRKVPWHAQNYFNWARDPANRRE